MKKYTEKEEREGKRERPLIYLKRKLMAALSMLLVAAILLTATSYAWLVLSVAPEVTGITTNVGANGSLEIALLTTETRQDLSKIRTTVGDSLGGDLPSTTANNYWGNLIDLSVKEYGLSDIVLMPARLDIQEKGDGYTLGSGFLAVPSYGYDGRIVKLENNAVGATYSGGKFNYILGEESYGVRAIGTSNTLTVQESALAMAKSNIKTYTKNANSAAAGALRDNGQDLFGIMVGSVLSGELAASYNDADLDVLKAIISDLQSAVDYIDSAIRQGIVAVAASRIDDEDTFILVRNRVMNTAKELPEIILDLSELGEIPDGYGTWVNELSALQNKLNAATAQCNALTGGSYSWDEIKLVMEPLINTEFVMINDTWFGDLTMSEATTLIGSEVLLTLAPGSGVFADIADYAGNYEASVSAMGTVVTIKTAHNDNEEPAYLVTLAAEVEGLTAAGGNVGGKEVELTTTFGYVLDLAFRCNAANADLLLQTAGIQRVYEDSLAPATMGGGSYMEFATKDSGFPLDKMIELMDAVRVGFVDDQGNLLGVAKLNTSNRTIEDGVVSAPLFLYDFSIEKEGENQGAMIMGERRKTDNTITTLEQNTAKAVSVVVWLDGDVVDNSKVSATHDASLYGMLNLQFATSADLVPAENGELKNITTSKTGLEAVVAEYASVYDAGQGFYTTASWSEFAQAYVYAQAVIENTNATPSQIYNASAKLVKAHAALEKISATALSTMLDEFREKYGETDDLARIVIVDEETGYYVAIDPYTEEQLNEKKIENGDIYRVDYTKNLTDLGNGVMTSVYTDSSWSVLAAAIYDAEAVNMDPKASYAQIDAAITALELAEQALQRRFYFEPYEYNGTLYYRATDDQFKNDSYGMWYDSDFKMITSDLTILTLNAQAEIATIATFDLTSDPKNLVTALKPLYVEKGAESITPYINLLNKIYPELDKDEIVAINWVYPGQFDSLVTDYQITQLQGLITKAGSYVLSDEGAAEIKTEIDVAVAKARAVIDNDDATADEAAEAAYDLKVAINKAAVYTAPAEDNFITADQRTVLNIAIETARGIAGFDNEGPLEDPEEQAKYDALREAVANAEDVLNKVEPLATKTEADEALAKLNVQLVNFGRKEVNEYNSLPIYIPMGSEVYEIVYATQTPYLNLKTNIDEVFEGELYALILTKNGVVYEAKVPVEVYVKAENVKINGASSKLTVGETIKLTAELISMAEELTTEEIAEYTWASDDGEVIAVSGAKSDECTLSAKAAGTVNILLTVKTVQGNLYNATVTVTVDPAP